jgi:hypothetical protein
MNTTQTQLTYRFKLGKWRFTVWKLSHFRFGWKPQKWDAGSFAILKWVLTYMRVHY